MFADTFGQAFHAVEPASEQRAKVCSSNIYTGHLRGFELLYVATMSSVFNILSFAKFTELQHSEFHERFKKTPENFGEISNTRTTQKQIAQPLHIHQLGRLKRWTTRPNSWSCFGRLRWLRSARS